MQCKVDKNEPSPADQLLAREEFKEAEAAYRKVLEEDANQVDARLGVVRSLIGQSDVQGALNEAGRLLQQETKSAVAEVAVAEANFRAANVEEAFAHAKSALGLNPCEGRAAFALSRMYDLSALYGTSAKLKAQAHLLRPKDELIGRAWIQSLPRKQRQAELAAYLNGKPALSQDELRGYGNELKHMEAHKAGECHISSKAEQTQTAMQVMYGDRSYPVAFGLDVSFDGKRRRMQIDTGASGIVLTDVAARGLGLKPEFPIKTGGIGDEGERDSYLSHVHSIQIGDVEIQDCMVEVVGKARLGVDGLIGMDVFDRWLVTLDYQGAKLRLSPLPARPDASTGKAATADSVPREEEDAGAPKDRYVAPEMKDWLSVARIGHEIFLPAFLKQNGPVHYMMMDTGAQESTFSVALAKEAGKLHTSSTEFHGISGKTKKVYETDRTGLIVGRFMLAPEEYYAFDLTNISHNSGFETSGFLGLPTLQRLMIQIDYRDNLLKLSYDPKRDIKRF